MTKRILAAISSGIILVLSFAPFGLWPLAFVAFVPLLISLEGQRGRRPFLLGYITGLVFFLGAVYWVVYSMHYYGGLSFVESLPVLLLLSAYLAIYFGFFALLSRLSPASSLGALLYLPALWVSLEYLRGHLFTGFPWVLSGYAPAHNIIIIQVADITGVYGLGFLIMIVNVALYLFIVAGLKGLPRPLGSLVAVAALLAAVVIYGALRVRQVDDAVKGWPTVRVAVAQGNINQSLKWDKKFQGETLRIYKSLTERAAIEGASLVVWPETAVPFYLERNRAGRRAVREIARQNKVRLLTGSPAYDYNKKTKEVDFYNSAYAVSERGRITGRYDKVHLVPYGEYVPLKRFMPFIKKLTEGVGDFVAGPGPIPLAVDGYKAGVLICYEAIFPVLARGSVLAGARLLVNITNDAWFGKTSAPYQHLDMSLLRAVENRVFLLRAANTGISAVIDPVGRPLKRSLLFTEDVLVADVGLKAGLKTIYTAYGDVFAYISLLFSGFVILVMGRRVRREHKKII